MLAIKLPPALEKKLEALARATGRPESDHAVEAIEEYVADLEDGTIAEKRLDDLDTGLTTAVPLHDLLKRHGLAD